MQGKEKKSHFLPDWRNFLTGVGSSLTIPSRQYPGQSRGP